MPLPSRPGALVGAPRSSGVWAGLLAGPQVGWRFLRGLLPAGGTLPEDAWEQRHRWVTGALWVSFIVTVGWQTAQGRSEPSTRLLAASAFVVIAAATVVASLTWPRLAPPAARRLRSCAASFGVMTTACYVVGLSAGAPEAHYLFFILVPVVALYEARLPLAVAMLVVFLEHGVVGTLDPASVFGRSDTSGDGVWTAAVLHSGLLALAGLASLLAWRSAEASRSRAAASVSQLQHQTRHDELTGLLNRTGLTDALDGLLTGAGGAASTPVAVIVMDLNRFKEVNDTLGHTAGDQLLRNVATVLAGSVDGAAVLARLGGDEFALVLPGADTASGSAVAGLVREQVRERSTVNGMSLDVDLSAGVSVHAGGELLDADGVTRVIEELLRHADIAMYAAKAAGGGAAVYDPALDHHSTARLEVARDLRRAVERDDELLLHFQPKVALTRDPRAGTGDGPGSGDRDGVHRLVGVEALVRWQHPTRGFMPPGDFIPVLESTDLVHVFTARMIDLALDQARAWWNAGYDVPIAVNAFPRCLTHPDFVPHVVRALHARSLPSHLLRLEITEDALVADPEAAAAVITELKELGVATSIDDFGTGYSSLSYLRRLPVDEVKLDRSFVTGLGGHSDDDVRRGVEPADEVLVSSIIDLAHRLGMKVVAEGIELPQETAVLQALGCDVGQGYLFARPALAEQLPAALLETARAVPAAPAVPAVPAALTSPGLGTPVAAASATTAAGLPRQRTVTAGGSSTGDTSGPAETGRGPSSG